MFVNSNSLKMSIWKSTGSGMVGGLITRRSSKCLVCLISVQQSRLIPFSTLDSRRKKAARESHKNSAVAQKLYGIKAKLHHAKRHAEKVQLKRPSRHTTSATSSKPTIPLPSKVLCRLTCWIVRDKRTPKPCLVVSRRGERTRLPSTAFPFPRFEVLPRRKCSR